ncbi:hypothetical protein JTB14_005684 [Gonioctena quinquepunctata]|nr:hypothetical protein JTB14_005684 [Gonioctena quinquepunctata]
MIRIREKRLSSNYSTDTNIFAVENRFVPQPMTQVVESQDSVDLSYNELVEERKNFLKKENFQPNLMASKKILNKFKAEVQNHAKIRYSRGVAEDRAE